jgi:hypothetical protein
MRIFSPPSFVHSTQRREDAKLFTIEKAPQAIQILFFNTEFRSKGVLLQNPVSPCLIFLDCLRRWFFGAERFASLRLRVDVTGLSS